MTSSVRTKANKNQPPIAEISDQAPEGIEPAITELERSVLRIMESNFSAVEDESERSYWSNRFKNIAMPISLALAEYRGMRHFHHHYRHKPEDDTILEPVLEPRFEMLHHACQKALRDCDQKLVGLHDSYLVKKQQMLERALRAITNHPVQ